MRDWYRPDLRITQLTSRTVEQSEVRIQMGDDSRWAATDWDDRTWDVIDRTRVPLNAGPFWLRVRVRTTAKDELIPALLVISGGSAQDIYWDGELMASSGIPGKTRDTERS